MATLVSPGVDIQIINESFYGTAGAGTVPLIVIATAANKTSPSGTGIAPQTLPSEAGKLFLATSQRELVQSFGNPIFKTSGGTPLHGHELNEYGLHAAYSYLGVSNRAYIVRADLDLAQLEASDSAPRGAPASGTFWFDLASSRFGFFVANGNTNAGLAWDSKTVKIATGSNVTASVAATGTLTFTGTGTASDTITINGQVITLVASGATGAQVNIGATATETAQNLKTYITANPGTLHVTATGSAAVLTLTATTAGTGGNSIATTESSTDASFAAATLTGGVDSGQPLSSFGSDGDFAFVPADASLNVVNKFFQKQSGTWNEIGSTAWATAVGGSPTVTMTNTAQYPSGTVAGSIWIKLSSPNLGANWVVKRYNSSTGQWVIVPAPFFADDATATANGITGVGQLYTNFNATSRALQIRRWNGTAFDALSYEASIAEPTTDPEDGTLWYSTDLIVDILVNSGGTDWVGYLTAYADTNTGGIMMAGTAPTAQDDGTELVDNDLWIDTTDLENYPRIYRFNATTGRWGLIDNTDQTTPFGVVFADARLSPSLTSDGSDLDPDAPDATAYPAGMLLFNMRASTGNVKVYRPDWFRAGGYDPNTDYVADGDVTSAARWVNSSGNRFDGAPNMLRKAQRAIVVRALAEAVASNEDIRSEIIFFNLVAAPGYPELLDELITLNTDQKEVAFIVGDTPARLVPQGLAIQNWAMNVAGAAGNGEDGLTANTPYVGVYYPWGLSTNIDGNEIVVPPSTMALRTIAYNDQVGYPWLAPAGSQRGLVTNATAVGYITSEGEFRSVTLNQGQRDVLYLNRINPIAFMPGSGMMVYGQKTLDPDLANSALDRINVARLTNYLRYHLDRIVKPFIFQPNDMHTRDAARITVERFLVGLVGLRALEDFAVVCDESNNTPERRDRNEMWIDIIVKPVKAVEFIYVPVRIRDSGAALTF